MFPILRIIARYPQACYLLAQHVMLRIPTFQLSEWHLHQTMKLCFPIIQNQQFLTNAILSKVRQDINPKGIVNSTYAETAFRSASVFPISKIVEGNIAYMASPTTQYVAHQKVTSPPNRPPGGGYHGMTRIKTLTARENQIVISHTLNPLSGTPNLFLRLRINSRPKVVANEKTLLG